MGSSSCVGVAMRFLLWIPRMFILCLRGDKWPAFVLLTQPLDLMVEVFLGDLCDFSLRNNASKAGRVPARGGERRTFSWAARLDGSNEVGFLAAAGLKKAAMSILAGPLRGGVSALSNFWSVREAGDTWGRLVSGVDVE